ncbi:uncharacterized protein BJ212DRAFT_944638 [Suillus subaureus]|uniref:Uncharacterized protein n=1 Tax=Suillus subaureus TaxID=48587 RepID=A0A9P7DVD2_9AGAM|nr:uncharacterized protein BJ212DRAFT_944638 [Suillus subaureus]KAG1804115.1 hypothetical protein BJ212DRAFT_944638 [Suillus subaureus]
MIFFPTPQSSSSPPDGELTVPESPYRRDHPNAMSSSDRPVRTFLPFDSSTSANPGAGSFPFPGRAGGTSGAMANRFGSAANMLVYPFNTFTYPVYLNGSMGSNISSNGDFPYSSEEATTTHPMMDDIARLQNHYPTADPMHYGSYELQPSLGYGDSGYNLLSRHGALYHDTAQGGIDAWYSSSPVTGGNPPPSYIPPMQYPDGCTPYRPQYVSPSTDASSSSCREPSSYPREPDSSAHYPGAYHASWPRCEDHAICDPQVVGSSLPEQPDPSMAPLPFAAIFSHPYIGHGDDTSNPSHRPPSIQPHQDLPHRNSRSRQNSRRRRRSHSYRTHHSPPSIATFSCDWLVGENTTCTFKGPLDVFKTHFRRSHLSGDQNAPNACRWRNCTYRKRDNADICVMRRDSVRRHVWETHLGLKRKI